MCYNLPTEYTIPLPENKYVDTIGFTKEEIRDKKGIEFTNTLMTFTEADCWGVKFDDNVIYNEYSNMLNDPTMKLKAIKEHLTTIRNLDIESNMPMTIEIYMFGDTDHGYRIVFTRNPDADYYDVNVYVSKRGFVFWKYRTEILKNRKDRTPESTEECMNEYYDLEYKTGE